MTHKIDHELWGININTFGVTDNDVFAFTIFFDNSYIEGKGRWRSKAVLRL